MKPLRAIPIVLLALGSAARAQTVIAPATVTGTLPSFYNSSVPVVGNLIGGITPATATSTAFPFSPTDQFTQGIGYVSQYGQWQGSIAYTFQQAASVSQMWLWNAYFAMELDHSLKEAQLTFHDAADQVIGTANVSFPQAVASVLTPDVVDLPQEVLGVKKVVVTVLALWGGNEISLRRMAFAGTNQHAGMAEADPSGTPLLAFPNPATDRSTIEWADAVTAEVTDAIGRKAPAEARISRERVVVDWAGCAPGIYQVDLRGPGGRCSVRVLVE